jgi:hypothetical protein
LTLSKLYAKRWCREDILIDGGYLSWRCRNPQRWETEQQVDGAPQFTATRGRGSWRLRPRCSTQVIGGFRTIEEACSYAARIVATAA